MADRILGLSAFYHDSAAALVVDGEIVAAVQQERFSRRKHDEAVPVEALQYCLEEGGLEVADLDFVAFYDKPLLKFDRLLETYLAYAPRGFPSFLAAMPVWLRQKLHLPREMRKALGQGWKRRPFVFCGHHESHAASAFYPSPFEEATVLSIDGVGEWETATIGHGKGKELQLLERLEFPHSLGLLYSAFTYFCGFKVNSGEYKLMGLAPYGKPRYREVILRDLLDLREDGSFALRMPFFSFASGLRMTHRRFAELFDGPPRRPETPLTEREMDLAASIQAVTEEIVQRMARHAIARTGCRNLCLAGGVALNCVANGHLLREGIAERIWIQPAAGDAGGALGAALFTAHQLLGRERQPQTPDAMQGSLLGPAFTGDEIHRWLESEGIPHEQLAEDRLLAQVVEALEGGEVIGWFQGRMEFGPRALGSRSILGDPRNPTMQSRMNLRVKFRESFRPFAPSVLREGVADWFEMDADSPYMLLVAPVCEHHRREPEKMTEAEGNLITRVNEVRSTIPAVTHVDHSARVQTVDARHGRYYRLLKAWEAATGCPVLINTSFNIRGEPLVCTPQDAWRCFKATAMDLLVLEDCLIRRRDLPALASAAAEAEAEAHRNRFELD